MYKLLITLINYRSGELRRLAGTKRYKTPYEARDAAQQMAYVNKDPEGRLTYECRIKIVEARDVRD